MANVSKIKLPDNTTRDIVDSRISSVDSTISSSSTGVVQNSAIAAEFAKVAYIGSSIDSATYSDGGIVVDISGKADKVSGATSGNFASLDSNGNLTDSGHKHSDYQAALVSGTNIKTINNESLLGSGNITVSSGNSGTVTSVGMTVPTGLFVSGSPVTTSGTLAVSLASGYSIPTTTKQGQWDAKQDALVSGTNIKTINNQSLLGSGNITISGGGGGGDTSDCVHITGDESVGGDKTFTDNIAVVDASHILYSGASPSQGFTRGTSFNNDSGNSITFSGLSGEPKAFILSLGDGEGVSAAGVIGVIGDSTGCHGVYTTGTQHNYSNGFTTSYSNGSFTITAPSGLTFPDWDWHLIYYAGSGTLTFKTSQVQPGSGATTATFTGTGLTELPAFYAVMLESQVNNESYRRVAYYTNDGDCFENNATPKAVSFFSSQIHNTTSSFSVSYNNGLYINSGGTNAGGYFHNPGTYTLYYLMASDIGGGGSGSYSSLADELAAINTTIGDIATILASI